MFGNIRQCATLRRIAFAFLVIAMVVAGCGGKEEREAEYFARGKELYAEGNFAKAGLEFRNVLQINPMHVESQYYLGLIAEKAGDLAAAISTFTKVSQQDPKHVPAKVKVGQYALLQDDRKAAAKSADEALVLEPENSEAHALKAAVLLREGGYNEAEAAANRALKTSPSNASAISVLAGIAVKRNDIERALALLDGGIAAHPADEGLQIVKLKIASDRQDVPKIEAVLRELVSVAPGNNAYKTSLAKFLLGMKRPDEAEQVFRDAITSKPEDKDLHLLLVQFLSQVRGPEAAITELIDLSKRFPEEYGYQFALADLYVQQKDSEKGRDVLKKIIEEMADAPEALSAKAALAKIALTDRDVAGATRLIGDVLAQDSANHEALLLRAGIAFDNADFRAAVGDLRSVLRDHPLSRPALLLLARTYAASSEEELTREAYRNYLQADPENDDVRVEFARKLMQTNRLDDAERQIDLALDHTPNHIGALLTRIDQRIARQSWAAAEAAAIWIIEKTDMTAQGRAALGKVLLARGRLPEAVAELRQAMASPEARSLLVQALEKSGGAGEAEALLQKAAKENPSDTEARILLADLSFRLGKRAEAEAALRGAIETSPDLDLAYLKLGDLYGKGDHLDQAADAYREGLKRLPRHAGLWLSLGMAEDSLNRYDAARDAYEAVLRLQPRNLVAANNLAALIADAWPQDRQLLERARRLSESFRNRDDAILLDTLGWVQFRLGNSDDAVPLLERAVALLPKHPQIRYHLGMAYRAKGDAVRARSELKFAVEANTLFRGSTEAERILAEL